MSNGVSLREAKPEDAVRIQSLLVASLGKSAAKYTVYLAPESWRYLATLFARPTELQNGLYLVAALREETPLGYCEVRFIGDVDHGNPARLDWEAIEAYAKRGVVIAPGRQENIDEWLSITDIYTLPSYREGVPRTILEAMAMGLPVITTDTPGCRETVHHEDNGLLIPARDVPALVRAITLLIQEPDLRAAMGLRSRQLAKEIFDCKIVVDQYIDLYRALLSPARKPLHDKNGSS